MPVTDEQIRKRLNELLETVDLETTSGKVAALGRSTAMQCPQQYKSDAEVILTALAERKLREMLEGEFQEDLKDRKATLREEVCQCENLECECTPHWHPMLLMIMINGCISSLHKGALSHADSELPRQATGGGGE